MFDRGSLKSVGAEDERETEEAGAEREATELSAAYDTAATVAGELEVSRRVEIGMT